MKAVQKDNVTPLSHVQVLAMLQDAGTMSVSEISRRLGIAKPNITPLVDRLFECGYVDRQHDENDRRVVNIYLTFAGLAIIVSCLGLFGLSLFEIRLRYREIALRKVHGAQTKDIVRLVLKRYLIILGVSALIGFPLAVWIIHQYMADYAFRTPLSWWIFALALVIVAIISASVLFWQVRKAANINPAIVMKSE
jgi:ABC-type antimicrobial peptide transport system permease subunit